MSSTPPKNPGVGDAGPFPHAGASDPSAPHLTSATVEVDAGAAGSPLARIWQSVGYDEFNWTYTPTGKRLLKEIGDFAGQPFHVRPHYVFISGSGFGLPHQGSGNVYHEREDGTPFYDWTLVDQAYDAIVDGGHHVLVELGFTPRDLVPDHAYDELTLTESPTVYSAYEAGHWGYPPKDYARWGELVAALARHSVERYGAEEVGTWLWELWNEPDIFYWRGTVEEFCELYAVTARAVRSVLPDAKVGGPTVTGGTNGVAFLRTFLQYVEREDLPLDFVSFHTKGSAFRPWRTYGPIGAVAGEHGVERQSPQTTKMLHEVRRLLRVMAEFERFAHLPAIVDECDAGVPAHWGVHDNPNFVFQNTEYYPVFQVALMKKLLDMNEQETARVEQATTWSFYFEGERYFEGTRALQTAGGVDKPFLNAYRALAELGETRLPVISDAGWRVADLDATTPGSVPEEIDALAARAADGSVAVLVYRHADDQYHGTTDAVPVALRIAGLGDGARTVRHLRIDADHSNAHTVWQAQGAPQDPTPEQLAELHARMGLEELEPARTVATAGGVLELTVALPLPAVSLLVVGAVA